MDPLVRWLRACPPGLVDVLVAVPVTVIVVVGTVAQATPRGYRHADVLAYVLAALAGISLAGRRRWPLAVFAVTLATSVIFAARGYPGGPALIAVIVAIYTAASLDTRWRPLALGVIAGVALSATRLIFTSETPAQTLRSALGFIGAALFLGWAVANRRAYVAEIRDRAERAERTREEEARRRVDAERLRIARELHDVVAHSISTINVQAGVAAHLIDSQPSQAGEALETIKRLSKEALAELREILNVLRAVDTNDSRQPTSGLAQLDALVERSQNAGMELAVEITGGPRPLPLAVDLAAYRIIQEAVTNALRHAGGAPASISLSYGSDELAIEVSDHGNAAVGGPPVTDSGGYGLIGMRERAESIGGTFQARRRTGGGFVVQATLPLAGPDAAPPKGQ